MHATSSADLALLDHVPIGVMVLRRDMSVIFWNSVLEEWTKVARDTIIGTNIGERFPNLQAPVITGRLESVFTGGPPVVFSSQLHHHIISALYRDDRLRVQHTIVTAVPSTNANEFYALFAIQDVTDLTLRLQEYRALREAERRQRILAEAMRDISATLSTTLNLDKVLDQILSNVDKVIAYTMVDIMLVENGYARIVRSHHQHQGNTSPSTFELKLCIAETSNLRQMAETRQPMIIPDTQTFPDGLDIPERNWIRSHAGAPIVIRGQLAGFLGLASDEPNFFSNQNVETLQLFANVAAVAIENARLYAEVQRLAVTDELTGLYNRRGFLELGEREIERALRFKHPLCAILFDIDHFKQVNDRFGHSQGDRVLCILADCCRKNIRAVDIAGRYGGEEFVILLPETNRKAGAQLAERLRNCIAQTQVTFEPGSGTSVTVSMGVADLVSATTTLAKLLEHADQAQYAAKQTGRNRVVVFNEQ